jgi:hypothetical protein
MALTKEQKRTIEMEEKLRAPPARLFRKKEYASKTNHTV